ARPGGGAHHGRPRSGDDAEARPHSSDLRRAPRRRRGGPSEPCRLLAGALGTEALDPGRPQGPRRAGRGDRLVIQRSRREFLKFLGIGAGSLFLGSTLAGCGMSGGRAQQAQTEPSTPASRASAGGPLRIGYLPITDAAPLLIAHAKGFYEAEGVE